MHAVAVDQAMRALAERQHSVISRGQARALGATKEILSRCTSLEWEPVGHGVLRLVGSVATVRQRAMVAVLSASDDEGATVSRRIPVVAPRNCHCSGGFLEPGLTRILCLTPSGCPDNDLSAGLEVPIRHPLSDGVTY